MDNTVYKEKIISLLEEDEELYFGDMVKKLKTSAMKIGRSLVDLIKEEKIAKENTGGKFKLV